MASILLGLGLIDFYQFSDLLKEMAADIDIEQMSIPDKLRIREALWTDISAKDTEVVSPEWHGDVLVERERLIASGEEHFIDWEVAKRQLREELQ